MWPANRRSGNTVSLTRCLVYVPEVWILLVRQILKGMQVALIRYGFLIALGVDPLQVPSQKDNDEQQQHVAAHVRGEGNEVSRCIPVQEDLRTYEVQFHALLAVMKDVPMALPVDHATKFMVTAIDFLV